MLSCSLKTLSGKSLISCICKQPVISRVANPRRNSMARTKSTSSASDQPLSYEEEIKKIISELEASSDAGSWREQRENAKGVTETAIWCGVTEVNSVSSFAIWCVEVLLIRWVLIWLEPLLQQSSKWMFGLILVAGILEWLADKLGMTRVDILHQLQEELAVIPTPTAEQAARFEPIKKKAEIFLPVRQALEKRASVMGSNAEFRNSWGFIIHSHKRELEHMATDNELEELLKNYLRAEELGQRIEAAKRFPYL